MKLDYEVRYVLAADAFTQIEEGLKRLQEQGVIRIPVELDMQGLPEQIAAASSEIQKVTSATEKLSRATKDASKEASGTAKAYSALASDIQRVMTRLAATRDVESAAEEFDQLQERINDFGAELMSAGEDMDQFYKLQLMLERGTNRLNRELNNSAGVIRARAAEQRAASQQQQAAARAEADSIRGTILELSRIAQTGSATSEQMGRLFGVANASGQQLQVTAQQLALAFQQVANQVNASNIPYARQQQLLTQNAAAQRTAAINIRNVNRALGQQEENVGNVSYAMLSFTRLIEDMPYGFRGFANNIQPTIFGLAQMNGQLGAVNQRFTSLYGRNLPFTVLALRNIRSALGTPINQILLLTSALATAGTLWEMYSQRTQKAANDVAEFAREYSKIFDFEREQGELFDFDIDARLSELEAYEAAINSTIESLSQTAGEIELVEVGPGEFMSMRVISEEEERRLSTLRDISKEAVEQLRTMRVQAEVQRILAESEEARAILAARNVAIIEEQNRALQQDIDVQRIRNTLGDEAAARERARLRIEELRTRFRAGEITLEEHGALIRGSQLQLEKEILDITSKTNRERRSGTDEMARQRERLAELRQDLQRGLEDSIAGDDELRRLSLGRARALQDLEATIADIRSRGLAVSQEEEQELISLQNRRYDNLVANEKRAQAETMRRLLDEQQQEQARVAQEEEFLQRQLDIQRALADAAEAERDGDIEGALLLYSQAEELERQLELSKEIAQVRREQFKSEAQYRQALERRTQLSGETKRERDAQDVARARMDFEDYMAERQLDSLARQIYAMRSAAQQEMAVWEDLHNRKLITYKEYSDKILAISKQLNKDETEARIQMNLMAGQIFVGAMETALQSVEARSRQQFEQQKRLAIGLATVNTLLGATAALRSNDPLPLKIANLAATLAAGYAQVNRIKSTQYGGDAGGNVGGGQARQAYGFTEVDEQARGGVPGTIAVPRESINVTVIGNVDREGIAFAVREGEDIIASRAIFQ